MFKKYQVKNKEGKKEIVVLKKVGKSSQILLLE